MKRLIFVTSAVALALGLAAPIASAAKAKSIKPITLTVNRKSLPSSGGAVTLRAKLKTTSGKCSWSVSPKAKNKLATKIKCKAAMAQPLHVVGNSRTSAKNYRVTLRRLGKPTSSATVTVRVKGKTVLTSAPIVTTTTTTAPASTVKWGGVHPLV